MTQKLPFGYLAERSSAAKPAGLCGGQPRSHSVLYRSPFSEKIVCLSLRDRIGKCVPSDGKNWNFISSEPFLRSDDTTAKWKALRRRIDVAPSGMNSHLRASARHAVDLRKMRPDNSKKISGVPIRKLNNLILRLC
jgi:hypothetical protein